MRGSKKTMSGVAAAPMLALGVTLVAGQSPQAQAQPDIKKQGAGEIPKPGFAEVRPDAAGNPKLLGERKVVEGGLRAEQYKKFTGERGQQMRENFVRQALMRQGITDEKTVDPILDCVRTQETAKQTVEEKSNRLRPALTNDAAMGDAQFNALLNEYQAAIEDYRDVREKAIKELDGKIGYSKKPRLQATLMMMNVIGDAPQSGTTMSIPGMTFTMAGGQGFNNFNGNFVGGFAGAPGMAGQPGQPAPVFGAQVQALPDGGVRVFQNPPVAIDGGGVFLAPPGFGAPPPADGPPPPADKQANKQGLEELRREFSEQIKQLREEINRLKAAQGNR